MTEPRSVQHRRATAARRPWRRRSPWLRYTEHTFSPQEDRWRAAAFPDQCGRALFGKAYVEPARPRPCLRCAHRHHHGEVCASHVWGDTCGYDAGADCAGKGLRPLRRRPVTRPQLVSPPTFTPVAFAPYLGPWLPEHDCPVCGVERADYEGPGRYLDRCPNCGAREAPVKA
jgi:hypothetical protein